MLKEFVEKILELGVAPTLKVQGRDYSTVALHPVDEPIAGQLEINTLDGLVSYLKSGKDGLKPEDVIIHVESHESVRVVSQLKDPWRRRERLVVVTRALHGKGFRFDDLHDAETFNIELQSKFVQTECLLKILAVAGNMTADKTLNASDDGISQAVTLNAGVTLKARAMVPNPVYLRPLRTFHEIEQPESPFVFRVKQVRDGEVPKCALFEADGGKWKLEAIQKIGAYLGKELPGVQIIA